MPPRKRHTAPQPQVPATAPRPKFVWNSYTIYRSNITPTCRKLPPSTWRNAAPQGGPAQ